MTITSSPPPLELWGGAECSVTRVGDTYFDQMERTGYSGRWDDTDLFAVLGVRALRLPVLWERVAPEGLHRADWSWPDERLRRLLSLRIRPMVGLVHHGSGPSHTSLIEPSFANGCVHIGVGRDKLTEKHWIYYPEDTVFHRIFVQGNASPQCNPPGGFGLTCEITYSPHKPLPCDGEALIQRCISDCHKVGFFKPEDPVWAAVQCDLPHAYVVYDHARPKNVAIIRAWLAEQDIVLAGRYSEWEYYNSDHAFLAGKKAADQVRQGRKELVRAAG